MDRLGSMNEIIGLMEKEMLVALGCTEPIAIAYAASRASKYAGHKNINKVKLILSGNVIKNAMSVKIPGADGSGINLAAALGALTENPDLELEVLAGITLEDVEKAYDMINNDIVTVELANSSKKLYIETIVVTDTSKARVIIEDKHTNITLVEVNGKKIIENLSEEKNEEILSFPLNLDIIWEFINSVDIEDLEIVKRSISLNEKIGLEGLKNDYGLKVGKTLLKQMKNGIFSDDIVNYAMALTAAGSDARMAGCEMSVMSNSGSGNQGITATLPVVGAYRRMNLPEDMLIRAVALSNLITIYIKLKFGRLSALCGVTIAGTGASCGIAYLMGGDKKAVKASIQNMLGNVTGMLCDGAKNGCALKVSTCVNAAMQSAMMACEGIEIKSTDGIVDMNPEKTIDNLCSLGNKGTFEADKIILDIMLRKFSEVRS